MKIITEDLQFDEFIKELSSFLKEYLSANVSDKSWVLKIKYGLILLKVNHKKKIYDIDKFLELFSFEKIQLF